MKISMKKLSVLRQDEIYFIFLMMRTYGGMEDPTQLLAEINNPSNNKQKGRRKRKQKVKQVDTSKPNLYDFTDPMWETCEEEKFLVYRALLEKAIEE